MKIVTKKVKLQTQGHDQMIDLTPKVAEILYEPGLIQDIKEAGERIAPSNKSYKHDETWGDGNGYSHLRSSIIGSSLTVPFESGQMTLGTWQQIVVMDHDVRPRSREVVIQIIGE